MEDVFRRWLFDPLVGKIVAAIVGVVAITALRRFLQRSLARYVKDSDTRYRVRKFVTFMGYLAGVLFLATVFSDQLGGLTVAFGVAGAGIALALQEVIASVAGWVAVSFGNFYRKGDRVQLGGIMGDVLDIGVLRTTLMECGQWVRGDNYNGRIVRIANSFVFKEPVFNYSADFPFLWDEITVPVKYGCDHRLAREILERVVNEVVRDYAVEARAAWERVIKKFMVEEARTEPAVTLVANDNWLEFTIRYVVDYKKRRATKDRLFTRILEEFEKTEGRVAIASATLQIVEVPRFDVRMEQRSAGSEEVT
ncbi:MAG: mechanosensitive ion channel family protein [Chloroflexi bacterium]|nr:mechanosensitive ion channel family protein [Chloroflexota bacterium]